ncbi:hypothetical protein ACGFX4_28340 [Kitasatospora sp. NPDC048365]|uniref:Rv1733c family protein n=1 Tax=Kitasatospora sp. NPDC048365 TaxID=3364050 RepID=UPI003711DA67
MRSRARRRGNPLRRGSDRVQWWLGCLLLATAVLALPAAAAAGFSTYRAQVHAGLAAAATRHPVEARLTADAPLADSGVPAKVPATAAWTAPDGSTRTAIVQVWSGERAGSAVTVWTDARGAVVPAPTTRSQAAQNGWLAAATLATTVPLLCLSAWKGAVLLLDRRRLAQWDTEWTLVEPRWTRRQPS